MQDKKFPLDGQDEKDIIINDLREELERMKNKSQTKLSEAFSNSTDLEKQLQESQDILNNVKSDLHAERKKSEVLFAEKAECEKQIAEMKLTTDSYLQQIAKLMEQLQETEQEITDIEEGHIAIQNQLKEEIKRTEDRMGQVSEEITRGTSSTHAQDILIRTVLQESELGRITMFIVDYFENPKRKVLARETIATELQIAPIIIRSHLRLLHGLGVLFFNEVTGEIKLVRQ